ncbi:hypothetical protein E3N88_22747 [Mikania micrantha]|uniref:Integrase catalytic domain-containing protein n=1 Tax=Mikania micrantha TaxID=192012 RepID=A0A5N6NBB8_9ASTR|nr:hypothetical protein E3N88_22747 [Mikania micrantha]
MQYVNKCLTCAQVKAEHQKPYGYVQPLEVPEWKWEHITMDFITKLPLTAKRHDAIWVIVDRLTKSAHFLPIRETYTSEKLSELFVKEIIMRHGVPVSIVSDRDTRFVSRFRKRFHESMGTRLNISTAYHPQTDGQSERTIQTLEDMLRACIIDFGGSWDDHLPLVEFSYNNSYHASIGMPPYEALYGRRCRTPVCWGGVGQKEVGSKAAVLDLTEKLQLVKARMKAAQDRQKSYADKRRRPIEFEVGDQVLLKVSPWKGIIRFRKRGKLSPRFIGPFRIMARVGKVAYRLDLPDELSGIHPTFHVSHLRKCLADDVAYVPLNDIEVDERLNYIEEPVAIVDTKEKQLRNKVIRQVKIQWKHRKGSEATWETEDDMKRLYPHLFEMRYAWRTKSVKNVLKRSDRVGSLKIYKIRSQTPPDEGTSRFHPPNSKLKPFEAVIAPWIEFSSPDRRFTRRNSSDQNRRFSHVKTIGWHSLMKCGYGSARFRHNPTEPFRAKNGVEQNKSEFEYDGWCGSTRCGCSRGWNWTMMPTPGMSQQLQRLG